VQKILGHSSILTTSKYTHLTSNTTKNAEQQLNQLMSGFSITWGRQMIKRSSIIKKFEPD
jgi:hypothetical protein